MPDMPNNNVATINDQKNCSFPNPNGCLSVGTFELVLIPINNNTWLNVSEKEWYVSDHIALLPVSNAAISLAIDIPKLPNSAAYTAILEIPNKNYSPVLLFQNCCNLGRTYLLHIDILVKLGEFRSEERRVGKECRS